MLEFLQNVYMQVYEQVAAAMQNDTLMGMTVLGMVGGLVTAIGYQLRDVPRKLWKLFLRYFTISVRINKSDPYFYPVLKNICSMYGESSWGEFFNNANKDDSISKIPSSLRYHRSGACILSTILLERQLEHANSYDAVTHTINIKAFGFRKKIKIDRFLEKSLELSKKDDTCVYRYTHYQERLGPIPNRSMDSIISHHTKDIISTLKRFRNAGDWYISKSIPYRLGIALYGPPGTGKTSTAIGIANELNMDLTIIKLSVSSPQSLEKAFSMNNQILLIEDIDTFNFAKQRVTNEQSENKFAVSDVISLSDLLNAIDGVCSGQGNILIITSNHIEKIDKALLRPGRIDKLYEMSYLDQELFEKICLYYYGEQPSIEVPAKLTAAEAQRIFTENQNDFKAFQYFIQENYETNNCRFSRV